MGGEGWEGRGGVICNVCRCVGVVTRQMMQKALIMGRPLCPER